MTRSDKIFLGLMGIAFVALLVGAHGTRRTTGTRFNETVDDQAPMEIVGMSLAPDCDPPSASPFKGRYVRLPPPLMAMLPSTTANATQGTALNRQD